MEHSTQHLPSNAPTSWRRTAVRAADARAADVRTAAGTAIPGAELRARRIAEEAEWWLDLAGEETRMRPSTLQAKAFGACAFSVHHGTPSLAVPSKLVGTSKHQPAIRSLGGSLSRAGGWVPLDVRVTEDAVEVSHHGRALGLVQSKHEPWVRALAPFGLGVELTRVTGSHEGFRVGCNVALVAVGDALRRRSEVQARDGAGGDGAVVAAAVPVPAALAAPPSGARVCYVKWRTFGAHLPHSPWPNSPIRSGQRSKTRSTTLAQDAGAR